VRIIVGFAPGGGTDILARLIGQWLSERLGQPFVIENRPGAGSNIGTEAVVRAAPDGYTLLTIASPTAINATLYEKLNYNFIRDIAPVSGLIRVPNVMEVNLSVPAKTVPEFIVYAKANPGKISMASSGIGTAVHVSGELFKMMTGVNMVRAKYSRGYKSFNHARFADLTDAGLREMVRRIPEWEPSRGTIGAFLKPHIIGAMKEHIRTRPPTAAMTHNDIPQLVKENIERWKIEGDTSDHDLDGVAKSRARKKATRRKATARAKKPAPVVPTARGNALGKLTDQQMKVYDNMHAKIPFSNVEMAKRLGVKESRVRQIKKDVDRILKQSM
jgi:hypothetical protein